MAALPVLPVRAPAGMKYHRLTLTQRISAVRCSYLGRTDKQRVSKFGAEWRGVKWTDPSHLGTTLKDYKKKFEDTGAVFDAPRSGRPRKLGPAQLQLAAALLRTGFTRQDTGARDWFVDVQHAFENCSELKEMCRNAGIKDTHRTFLKRILEFEPKLIDAARPEKSHFPPPSSLRASAWRLGSPHGQLRN